MFITALIPGLAQQLRRKPEPGLRETSQRPQGPPGDERQRKAKFRENCAIFGAGIGIYLLSNMIANAATWTDSIGGALWGLYFSFGYGLPVMALLAVFQYAIILFEGGRRRAGVVRWSLVLVPHLALLVMTVAFVLVFQPSDERRWERYLRTDAPPSMEVQARYHEGGLTPTAIFYMNVDPADFRKLLEAKDFAEASERGMLERELNARFDHLWPGMQAFGEADVWASRESYFRPGEHEVTTYLMANAARTQVVFALFDRRVQVKTDAEGPAISKDSGGS